MCPCLLSAPMGAWQRDRVTMAKDACQPAPTPVRVLRLTEACSQKLRWNSSRHDITDLYSTDVLFPVAFSDVHGGNTSTTPKTSTRVCGA